MDPLLAALLRPEAYDHPVEAFELHETHISWVILTGPWAYKIKKPVSFGFVDFSTLERRETCCRDELRLNQRLTPELYVAVKPIHGPLSHASFVGDGPPLEFAVQMRQFPQSALLPAVLQRGELQADLLDDLMREVARFQRHAAVAGPADPWGDSAGVRQPVDDNFAALQSAGVDPARWQQLQEWAEREFARCEPEFVRRKAAGRIREGHGDLHLGNMLLLNGSIRMFDCLEFNASLRWIDVVSEVAFLVMDLEDRGRADLANRVVNGWLMETGDYGGLAVWNWYFTYRAMVRAKVAALRRQQPHLTADEQAEQDSLLAGYLQLAERATRPITPHLWLLHGPSGAGKSVLARRLCERDGGLWLRSDVERKRLCGMWGDPLSDEPPPTDAYAAATTSRTYDRLLQLAGQGLRAGWWTVVDATLLKRRQRQLFIELARELAVPCTLIDVQAPVEVLRARMIARMARGDDPSDATPAVLEQQLATCEPLHDEGCRVIAIDTTAAVIELPMADQR